MPVIKRWMPALFGAAIFLLLALLDFVLPHGSWYASHPMSAAAISSAAGFIAAGLILDGWLKEREARRLERVSTVAYRSLAQYANDVGRTLLAPIIGADLYASAVPEATAEDANEDLSLLRARGHDPSALQRTGSWVVSRELLHPVLVDLLHEPTFVRRMFRRTAVMRRRLQEGTALWASVMLTSRNYSDDLGRLRDLTDAVELLQEHWRKSGLIGAGCADWNPSDQWVAACTQQYWETIAIYEAIRDAFGDLAQLPSDAIVRRKQ